MAKILRNILYQDYQHYQLFFNFPLEEILLWLQRKKWLMFHPNIGRQNACKIPTQKYQRKIPTQSKSIQVRYASLSHPTLRKVIKQFQNMSFPGKVFGWALEYLWNVLVFIIYLNCITFV